MSVENFHCMPDTECNEQHIPNIYDSFCVIFIKDDLVYHIVQFISRPTIPDMLHVIDEMRNDEDFALPFSANELQIDIMPLGDLLPTINVDEIKDMLIKTAIALHTEY